MTDILVVGGGPAGLTAALYALRNGKTVTLLEKNGFGGQITYSPKVENWPGTPQMSGNEFADALVGQVLEMGAEAELEEAISVAAEGDCVRVQTEGGRCFTARAVILACGVKHRRLGLPGETELIGNGISFCAVCDGDFYTDRDVCVVGGGNSALQEAILLAGKCRRITVLQDLPTLTGETKLQEVLLKHDNVSVRTGVRITSLLSGKDGLTGVTIEEKATGNQIRISCEGLFVAIGLIPENQLFASVARLDSRGYFDAGEDCLTGTPGIYVAGDCRRKDIRQLTTATADGAVAALAACRFIDGEQWQTARR